MVQYMERERGGKGRFTRETKVETNDIFTAVESHSPASTREIVDEVGISRQALRYIDDLADANEISKKVGSAACRVDLRLTEKRTVAQQHSRSVRRYGAVLSLGD